MDRLPRAARRAGIGRVAGRAAWVRLHARQQGDRHLLRRQDLARAGGWECSDRNSLPRPDQGRRRPAISILVSDRGLRRVYAASDSGRGAVA